MSTRIIHIDECGYTGQNLLNPQQPLLVVSSVSLPADAADRLRDSCFSGTQASELKYSKLRKSPGGRASVIRFLSELGKEATASGGPIATTFFVHKRFNLLTLLIDWWVEPAMHADGIDLYKRKGNLALANACWVTLESLIPKEFDKLLRRFEEMMRERSRSSYERFWGVVRKTYDRASETVQWSLVFFLGGELRLGFSHLLRLPDRVLDVTRSCVLETVAHYRVSSTNPFVVLHDDASYMSHDHLVWDALTKPETSPQPARIRYPLGVEETRPVSSAKHIRCNSPIS